MFRIARTSFWRRGDTDEYIQLIAQILRQIARARQVMGGARYDFATFFKYQGNLFFRERRNNFKQTLATFSRIIFQRFY